MKRRSVSDFYLTLCFGKQEMHKTVKAKNLKNTCLFALLGKIEKKKEER